MPPISLVQELLYSKDKGLEHSLMGHKEDQSIFETGILQSQGDEY